MSDKIKEITIIPFDVTIDLSISGEFYARFSQFVTQYFPFKDQQHFTEVVKHIKEDTNQEDPFVYNYKTLVALLAYIEQSAKNQGKLKTVKYDFENDKVIEEENQPDPQAQ